MNKRLFLILSIVALVLFVLGPASKVSVLTSLGALVTLVVWIGGLVKMAQLKRWGWFAGVFFFAPLSTLIYGVAGPENQRGA